MIYVRLDFYKAKVSYYLSEFSEYARYIKCNNFQSVVSAYAKVSWLSVAIKKLKNLFAVVMINEVG